MIRSGCGLPTIAGPEGQKVVSLASCQDGAELDGKLSAER